MKQVFAIAAVLLAALGDVAGAATTRLDAQGTVLVDGRKVFPIVLAKGPEGSGVAEVADAGVNFLKVGPASSPWVAADFDDALERNREAAARGIYTWVNLATLADATARAPSARWPRHRTPRSEATVSTSTDAMRVYLEQIGRPHGFRASSLLRL